MLAGLIPVFEESVMTMPEIFRLEDVRCEPVAASSENHFGLETITFTVPDKAVMIFEMEADHG